MQLEDVLHQTIRPRILINAAKIGLRNYSRNRDLKRLFRVQRLPKPGHALSQLARHEQDLEQARKTGNAAYDLKMHIQIMTALLQEISLLPKKA